jgi:ubiquinone/menaquinone biosynthesis C-methylase UbiE
MTHIRAMMCLLFELSKVAVQTHRWPDDRLFVKAVYRACLKREPDADGEAFYLAALRRGSMSKVDILRSVLESNEFKQIYGLPVHPLNALHQARMMLIRQHLPMARVIVDLGGTAEDHPEGALLVMGYPYHPSEITIVDPVLPRLLREHGKDPEWITPDGVRIRYHQGSMTDLVWIPDQSVDLVFAGESIEHVSETEAWTVCAEVFRILKPGGYFCLDTPNAALTRLQSPERLIHPEHKKEYMVHEIREMLERAGFVILETLGICPMPESLRQKVFDPKELIRNICLSQNPEEGYLFFVKAIKPHISGELSAR